MGRAALDAARRASPDAFDDRFPGFTLASAFPSLHLHRSVDLEKLGRLDAARLHAAAARTSSTRCPTRPSDG